MQTLLVFLKINKNLKVHKITNGIILIGFIFADRRTNGIFLGKNLAGSLRDKINTPFLLLKMTKKQFSPTEEVLELWEYVNFAQKMTHFQTVFLIFAKITLILKFKACQLFFIFSLKDSPSKIMKDAFHFIVKVLFFLKIF